MLKAFNALAGYDDNCATYIAASNATPVEIPVQKQSEQTLYQAIVQGLKGTTETLTNKELEDKTPETIINEILIPALTEVGEKFEKGTLFLPQLINSAETAKAVFAILAKHFKQIDTKKEKIILATVQGDIHDIGKNIVKIVLESHGFQIIDLGKNVAIEKVVEAFGTHQPDAIGLSALMTTTVDAMAKTIAELRKLPNICPIFVGGAVVTEQIAKEIGADLYGADALTTVNKLEELWKNNQFHRQSSHSAAGRHISRIDTQDGFTFTTYDLRVTRPNFEPVMNTTELHSIEHLGATFFRNTLKETLYFGPMGCRTGFYLIVAGKPNKTDIIQRTKECCRFIIDFEGKIPGQSAEECGNYTDLNLEMAQHRAQLYLNVLENLPNE